MIRTIDVEHAWSLEDYSQISHLVDQVRELRTEASFLVPPLRSRTRYR